MRHLRIPVYFIVVTAGCFGSADSEPRQLSLIGDSTDVVVREMILSRSRLVLEILAGSDTSGLGAYLAPEFRWIRAGHGSGSPTMLPRFRSDPRFFDRLPGGIPRLAHPAPSRLHAQRRGETGFVVQGLRECATPTDCDPRPMLELRWRRTAEGWDLAELLATGEPR
jgi:hypothetical protein